MQCQVRSMAEASAAAMPEEGVQEGRVGQVCREWLVREDGVLAYKLQHEEISSHYDGNRFRNRVVRTDLVEAKTLQEIEKEEAQLVQEAYERMLLEQEERDAEVARRLQDELLLEDNKKQQSTVEEDKRLALELQKRERLLAERRKKEREMERERRQVEQVHATQIAHVTLLKSEEQASAACASAAICATSSDTDDIDLTDFISEPPEGLSEKELKSFFENQDAEIARFLQEQETKRRGAYSRDRQLAIEAQDMELCRVLQEQEKARLEKARLRKARDKSLLKSIRDQRKLEKEQAEDAENPIRDSERLNDEEDHGGVTNVAMMLDPTYGRKNNPSLERPHSASSPSQGSSSLDNSNTPSPLKSPSTQSTGSSPLLETLKQDYLEQLEDDNDPVPPYMPIQGQRRMASLEKNKKKKSRDSCKTQ